MEHNIDHSANNEEKMLSLLCHFSIFFGGIILPIVIWAIQKDKSRFVKFHALQTIWFHIAYIAAIFLFLIVIMVMYFIGLSASLLMINSSDGMAGYSVIMVIFLILFYGVFFLIIFGAIGYAVYMGVKAYRGELAKYPVIGNIIYRKVYGGF